MNLSRPWVRRVLAVGLVVATAVYLGRTIAVNWRQLADYQWRFDFLLLLGSVVAHVGVLAWGVFVWSLVVRHFAVPRVSFPTLLRIWSLSNATRYVPGVVWQFLTAAQLSGSAGLPQVVMLSSLLAHVVFTLVAACLVAVFTLPLVTLGLPAHLALALRVATPVAALLGVHPHVINFGLRLVPRRLHGAQLRWHGRWLDGVALLGLSCFSWGLYGAAYLLFVKALAPVPLAALGVATGVNSLSFVAGYLAVPIPGGVGVRESAMTRLLAPLLPTGVAAVVSIAARGWSIVAELTLALLGILAARRTPAGGVEAPTS